MKLNIETLTQEQKIQLDLWYKIYLNENNKLVTEEPTENLSDEFIIYKANLIKKNKKVAIENIATLSDELNLLALSLEIVVDTIAISNPEILENPIIIDSKDKFEKIKEILSN